MGKHVVATVAEDEDGGLGLVLLADVAAVAGFIDVGCEQVEDGDQVAEVVVEPVVPREHPPGVVLSAWPGPPELAPQRCEIPAGEVTVRIWCEELVDILIKARWAFVVQAEVPAQGLENGFGCAVPEEAGEDDFVVRTHGSHYARHH